MMKLTIFVCLCLFLNDSFGQEYAYHSADEFCSPSSKVPFYQRNTDGAICCRGTQLPVITIPPEATGECAISTKAGSDGIIDTQPLWCSYTCSLKKLGAIDKDGKIVPEKFLDHLGEGLATATKDKLKSIMDKYLGCYKSIAISSSPCHTPLAFHKCFNDALLILCKFGVPANNDFSKFPKVKAEEYGKLQPFCYFSNRKIMPGCCHEQAMPWTVMEIMESERNDTEYANCVKEMGVQCDATCIFKSLNMLNVDLDLDVDKFAKLMLKHFPSVKTSSWMDFLGPVFLFFDDVQVDIGEPEAALPQRICRFHDRVIELHESKVEQYCSMSKEEVKLLVAETSGKGAKVKGA